MSIKLTSLHCRKITQLLPLRIRFLAKNNAEVGADLIDSKRNIFSGWISVEDQTLNLMLIRLIPLEEAYIDIEENQVENIQSLFNQRHNCIIVIWYIIVIVFFFRSLNEMFTKLQSWPGRMLVPWDCLASCFCRVWSQPESTWSGKSSSSPQSSPSSSTSTSSSSSYR